MSDRTSTLLRATPFHDGAVVPEDALGPELSDCPCCGAPGGTPVARLQRDPIVSLLRCLQCGAASARRQPTDAFLHHYYATYYDGSADNHTFDQAARLAEHILRFTRLSSRRRSGENSLRIVDFGSGDGAVALALAETLRNTFQGDPPSIIVDVVDLHPHPVSEPDGVTVRAFTDLTEVQLGADLVIASAILEHLHAPETTLQSLVDLIGDGGYLYARTPCNAALARWVPGFDLGYPGHLHDLGPDWWNGVAGRRGWGVRTIRSAPSIVETTLATAPTRTLLAHLLKAPAHAQARLRSAGARGAWWPICGGWEVVWQRR